MNIKIIRAQLTELIKEKVERYNRIQELQTKKQKLDEALQKLEVGENIEELWGGMKHLFNRGKQAAGQKLSQAGQSLKTGAQALGQDFKDVYGQAAQSVKQGASNAAQSVSNAAGQVKQTYQHGERISQTSKTQKDIAAAYAEKRALDAKIKALQAKHQQLTGQPYTPTRLNYKAPQATPPPAKTPPMSQAAE